MEISEKQARHAKFWKKFLRLTRGRVPVLRALAIIGEEEKRKSFKSVVISIRKDMDKGKELSEAIVKHPKEFSPSILELVKSAEKSGAWDEILKEISEGLQDGTFE